MSMLAGDLVPTQSCPANLLQQHVVHPASGVIPCLLHARCSSHRWRRWSSCCSSAPQCSFGAVPLVFVYVRVQHRFSATSLQLKRLDSVAFSPILSHLTETLQARSPLLAAQSPQISHCEIFSDGTLDGTLNQLL